MHEVLVSICLVTNIACAIGIFACFRITYKNEVRRSKLLIELEKERKEQEMIYGRWKEIVLEDVHDKGQGTD